MLRYFFVAVLVVFMCAHLGSAASHGFSLSAMSDIGRCDQPGTDDGAASTAMYEDPMGLAADGFAGGLVVADKKK